MKIWIDADACPKVIKEILFRAADRTKIEIILVANQYLDIPKSKLINFIKVKQGLDVADSHIVQHLEKGDLVVTADIPLANDVVNIGTSLYGILSSKQTPIDSIKIEIQKGVFFKESMGVTHSILYETNNSRLGLRIRYDKKIDKFHIVGYSGKID